MRASIKILSTDFDGTLRGESENPPVSAKLQRLIAQLQASGVIWVINTGRDLRSLLETLDQDRLDVRPDYLVTVEREILQRRGADFVELEDWNRRCRESHDVLFRRIRPDLPGLMARVSARFRATVYEDPFSPFCFVAESCDVAEDIHHYLASYVVDIPELALVRNDVYARFSHSQFNKGSALGRISAELGASADQVVAAGDHLNDLPMLRLEYAKWLIAPSNAVEPVQKQVRLAGGHVSQLPRGEGVFDGLRRLLLPSEFQENS